MSQEKSRGTNVAATGWGRLDSNHLLGDFRSIVGLEDGEVMLGNWWANAHGISLSDVVVLTSHRLVVFSTRGVRSPRLLRALPGWCIHLEEMQEVPDVVARGGTYYLRVKNKLLPMSHPKEASEIISKARLRRITDLSLRRDPLTSK